MKKYIPRAMLVFAAVFFVLGVISVFVYTCDGLLFHGHTAFSTVLSVIALFGAGGFFLAPYRIIDLLEH